MKLGKHTRIRSRWRGPCGSQAARRRGPEVQGPDANGNQGHAEEGTRLIREWVEAGLIRYRARGSTVDQRPIWPQAIERPLDEYYTPATLDWDLWLGPRRSAPTIPVRAFKWRGWWDFGTGALGDIACHSMDASFWTLGLGYPSRIEAESTKLFAETAPACSRITYSFARRAIVHP